MKPISGHSVKHTLVAEPFIPSNTMLMKNLHFHISQRMLTTYLFLTFVLLFVLFTSGCEKDQLSSSILGDKHISFREGVTDPTLQYGYLLFSDRTHLETFYAYLELVADTATDLDQALNTIASRLGHNALLYSDTAAFSNHSSMFKNRSTVYDPLRRVILNSKHEVGIGDSLFVIQNRWQTYSFPLGDSAMRDTLDATPKGTGVDITKITPSTRLVDSDTTITTRGNYAVCFQLNGIFRAPPCVAPMTAGVWAGSFYYGLGNSFAMDIDWGDGNSTIDGTNLGDDFFLHTYSTAGTYTIASELTTSCLGAIYVTSIRNVTVGGECDGSNIDTARWAEDDEIAMIMNAWSRKDIFGSHVGGKTTCYEYGNDNKWHSRKGEVSVDVEADFRNSSCSIEDSDTDSNGCGNCKSRTTSVTSSIQNFYHVLGDATTYHSVDRGGVELIGSIVLDYKCD